MRRRGGGKAKECEFEAPPRVGDEDMASGDKANGIRSAVIQSQGTKHSLFSVFSLGS